MQTRPSEPSNLASLHFTILKSQRYGWPNKKTPGLYDFMQT
jgi:hypothetical protein